MKVDPSDPVERSPFGFDFGGIRFRMVSLQGLPQRLEVAIENVAFPLFASAFVETRPYEVGEILHAATATHVLKINCGALSRDSEKQSSPPWRHRGRWSCRLEG